jgi:hypothetical protein
VTDAQGIEAEIPQASRGGAEKLERIARFFAAFKNGAAKNAPKSIGKIHRYNRLLKTGGFTA